MPRATFLRDSPWMQRPARRATPHLSHCLEGTVCETPEPGKRGAWRVGGRQNRLWPPPPLPPTDQPLGGGAGPAAGSGGLPRGAARVTPAQRESRWATLTRTRWADGPWLSSTLIPITIASPWRHWHPLPFNVSGLSSSPWHVRLLPARPRGPRGFGEEGSGGLEAWLSSRVTVPILHGGPLTDALRLPQARPAPEKVGRAGGRALRVSEAHASHAALCKSAAGARWASGPAGMRGVGRLQGPEPLSHAARALSRHAPQVSWVT